MLESLRPGVVTPYLNMIPNSIMAALSGLLKANGVHATLTYWTKPATADPAKKCSVTYVLRTDGLTEREVELLKLGTDQSDNSQFIFDPVAWNEGFPEGERIVPVPGRVPKRSKVGWECMTTGESRILRLPLRDVRQLLAAAMIRRNLAWTFEIRRMRHLEAGSSRVPVWQVMRIT